MVLGWQDWGAAGRKGAGPVRKRQGWWGRVSGAGQGRRKPPRLASVLTFHGRLFGESWPLNGQPTGHCPDPMLGQTGAQSREPAQSRREVWGRAETQSLSSKTPDSTHLGPGCGRQPHRSHVGAPDGLDLLQVLVKVFVHELCLKHKTVKCYITSKRSHRGSHPRADKPVLGSSVALLLWALDKVWAELRGASKGVGKRSPGGTMQSTLSCSSNLRLPLEEMPRGREQG